MKLADSTFVATLVTTTVAAILAKAFGAGGWVFAVANLAIVVGYTYTAIFITPYFKVDRGTRQAATLFFFLCAATHVELAVHFVSGDQFDWDSWHLVLIHSTQAASIARFVYGLRRSAIVDRDTLRDLTDSAEADDPNGESVRKAREALGE